MGRKGIGRVGRQQERGRRYDAAPSGWLRLSMLIHEGCESRFLFQEAFERLVTRTGCFEETSSTGRYYQREQGISLG